MPEFDKSYQAAKKMFAHIEPLDWQARTAAMNLLVEMLAFSNEYGCACPNCQGDDYEDGDEWKAGIKKDLN